MWPTDDPITLVSRIINTTHFMGQPLAVVFDGKSIKVA